MKSAAVTTPLPAMGRWHAALVPILILFIVTAQHLVWREKPMRMEPSFPANSAIGISLTAAGGSISIRHADGSFEDVGRIKGDAEYLELMQRLSSPKAKHLSPPYDSLDDQWADAPRHFWRDGRKRLGLPASPDVGVLAKMIKQLLDLLPASDSGLSLVVASYPGIVALYDEDVDDAAEYLGVRLARGYIHYQPREIAAAYAGHGMGLCEHYEDKERCRTEGMELPVSHALLVEYTPDALLLHGKLMREAYGLGGQDITAVAAFNLGGHHWRDEGYAVGLRAFVGAFLGGMKWNGPAPEEILAIITGEFEDAQGEVIQLAVRGAVEDQGARAALLADNPTYAASRGAAELAWRSQYASRS